MNHFVEHRFEYTVKVCFQVLKAALAGLAGERL